MFALVPPHFHGSAEELRSRLQIMLEKYLGEVACHNTFQQITTSARYNFVHCFYLLGGYFVDYKGVPIKEDDIAVSVTFNPDTRATTIQLMEKKWYESYN